MYQNYRNRGYHIVAVLFNTQCLRLGHHTMTNSLLVVIPPPFVYPLSAALGLIIAFYLTIKTVFEPCFVVD